MSDDLIKTLRDTALRVLRPLVRVLLRHGMAYGTFAELARHAYVIESRQRLLLDGRRATVSAIAAQTGLTRKETKRIIDAEDSGTTDGRERYNRAVRVVSGWLVYDRFLDTDGQPAALALHGDASFETLVKEYSGDIPPGAMLDLLTTSGTAAAEGDRVRLLARAYLPAHTPVENLQILGRDTAELLSTINHNLQAPKGARFFQRKVSNTALDPSALEEFRAFSQARSQALLEEYHGWLSAREVGGDADPRYVAVGIYYYDDTLQQDRENTP